MAQTKPETAPAAALSRDEDAALSLKDTWDKITAEARLADQTERNNRAAEHLQELRYKSGATLAKGAGAGTAGATAQQLAAAAFGKGALPGNLATKLPAAGRAAVRGAAAPLAVGTAGAQVLAHEYDVISHLEDPERKLTTLAKAKEGPLKSTDVAPEAVAYLASNTEALNRLYQLGLVSHELARLAWDRSQQK